MTDVNELRRLMDFYDQQGLGSPYNTHGDSPWSGSTSRDQDAANRSGARLAFAQRMMGNSGQQSGGTQERMPNYFAQTPGFQPAQYQPPQQAPQQQPQTAYGDGWQGGRYGGQAPMGGQMRPADGLQNYLAQLLKVH